MQLDRIDWRESFPAASLGFFMLLAGLSKFFIIEYWTGYEPQLLVQLIPFAAEKLVLFGGIFEAALGAFLVVGRKTGMVSFTIALYLGLIALQMFNLGIWGLAVRDLGLVLYASTVYLIERN